MSMKKFKVMFFAGITVFFIFGCASQEKVLSEGEFYQFDISKTENKASIEIFCLPPDNCLALHILTGPMSRGQYVDYIITLSLEGTPDQNTFTVHKSSRVLITVDEGTYNLQMYVPWKSGGESRKKNQTITIGKDEKQSYNYYPPCTDIDTGSLKKAE